MKKIFSVILVVMMLSTVCATLAVSADAQAFFVDLWNPADASVPTANSGIIYTTTNTTNGWWFQAAFAPEGNNWKVVEIKLCDGTAAAIPENGFIWALHPESTINNYWNFIAGMQVGEVYSINGLDLANQTVAADATIAIYTGEAEGGDTSTEEPSAPAAEWADLWVTHYNDNTAEGAGSVFTGAYEGAAWWLHVAFAPVEGSNVAYEIVSISNGTPDGSGVAQAIPEGGFVYALNYGNDYPSLNMGDINYATAGAKASIEDALANWKVGDKFVFKGIDLANATVPTSTPDVAWYDASYVCTAQYKVYEPEVDDVVEDEPSEEESKEETTPNAGDASTAIVFALIALVAIAGSAVVIKTRG